MRVPEVSIINRLPTTIHRWKPLCVAQGRCTLVARATLGRVGPLVRPINPVLSLRRRDSTQGTQRARVRRGPDRQRRAFAAELDEVIEIVRPTGIEDVREAVLPAGRETAGRRGAGGLRRTSRDGWSAVRLGVFAPGHDGDEPADQTR